MKTLIFQVCIKLEGEHKLYDFCMASVEAYAKRIGADYEVLREQVFKIPVDMSRTNRNKNGLIAKCGNTLPIFEKSVALTRFPEYDKICIIDADIYIRETAPNIFDELEDYDFGGVLERDLPLTPSHRSKIQGYSRDMFKKAPCNTVEWDWNENGAAFANMGMMLVNKSFMKYIGDDVRSFILQEEFANFRDGIGLFKYSTDQVLYNYFLKKSDAKVKHLDWKWNALYRGVVDNRLPEAHFVHFFLKNQIPNNGENIDMVKRILKV